MAKSTCTAPTCDRPHYAHGLCKRDYDRAARGRPTGIDIKSPEYRYEQMIDRSGGPDACHPWLGARHVTRGGYGWFSTDRKKVLAHRWGYKHYVGPLRDDEMVRHTCDNPPCQNPRHWLPGDHRANTDDMLDRDRHSHGERRWSAKLTVEQVHRIRNLWTNHYYRGLGRDLCAEYGVSKMTISNIVNGKNWRSD